MAETEEKEAESPEVLPSSSPPPSFTPKEEKEEEQDKAENPWQWKSYSTEDLKRTVFESTDSAIRSARSIHENSSTHIQTLQDLIPTVKSQYKSYAESFFKKVKDELMSAREHPAIAGGVAVATGLLLMRGTRRFLFRHTLGRLQSEEALYNKAERNVKKLNLSVDLMKKESKKLLERAAFAKTDMKRGHTEVMSAGNNIQRLAKSVYKIESQASDLMDGLREIPGREALKLRAEVATMASDAKQQRMALDKRVAKISDLGVAV